jgi:hypothetical protein
LTIPFQADLELAGGYFSSLLEVQSQTDLLKATEKSVDVVTEREGSPILNDLVISPVASYTSA